MKQAAHLVFDMGWSTSYCVLSSRHSAHGAAMTKLSEEAIERAANRFRDRLDLKGVSAPCIMNVLEVFRQRGKSFSYRTGSAEELGQDEARMDETTHTLIVRDSVMEDVKAGRERARFTIAHELGHYLLGHEGVKQRTERPAAYPTAGDRIEEAEANLFASYFLVPTQQAWDAENPEEIAMRFQVSLSMAEIAFERIARAKRKAAGQRRRPPKAAIDFLKEAERRGYHVRSDLSGFNDEDAE